MWTRVSRRLAKKVIGKGGRDMFRRLCEFHGFKVGDLVCTCDGLNSHVVSVEPVYVALRRGKVLVDLDFVTDRTGCSVYNCGVQPPITYEQAVAYREHVIRSWQGNDVWGFVERYGRYVIQPDGTYVVRDETADSQTDKRGGD
jgi:hypothetical protein